jgi:S1-C subfamily serine protease
MRRTILLTPLAVLMLVPLPASSDERNRFADVLALQEAVHQSIERAEPSIACILVSRSEKYRVLEGVGPHAPGHLGRLDLGRVRLSRDDPQSDALARLDLSDPENVPEAYGSGVVIDDKEGLVLTLAHVVRNATKIYVRLPPDRREAGPTRRGSWADIHALDTRSDLAVLHLIDRVPNLKALKLGDGGKLRKGDFVLSLSNPFAAGFRDGSPSASWGIVSNLRRRATGVLTDIPNAERNSKLPLYCFNTLIQTDTRLNLGCSGGALLNLQGELVGLISSLAGIAGGETPGGFAVPLDDGMHRILDVLRRGEEVEYGFLGVVLKPPEKLLRGYVQIDRLIAGGPAARAGIRGAFYREGGFRALSVDAIPDYILSINDTPIRSNDDLFLAVGMHLAGNTVRVWVSERPDGPRRPCSVTLAKFPSLDPVIASKRPPARGGLRVDWTSIALPRHRFRARIPEGVLIREVLPASAAANAGLQPDMIIKRVNRKIVTNPSEFYREMEKAHGPVELTFSSQDEDKEDRVTINLK